MTLPVFLRRAAELDLAAIEDWYDSQREGLGGEFRQVVDEAITRIAVSLLSYPERYRFCQKHGIVLVEQNAKLVFDVRSVDLHQHLGLC